MSAKTPGNVPPNFRPLAYQGIKEKNPPQLYFSNRAPTANDIRAYDPGDIWIDQANDAIYMLIRKTRLAATWELIGIIGGEIRTLTGDVGGAVTGDAVNENVDLIGGVGVSTTGNPAANTMTIDIVGGGLTWTEVVGIAQAMAINNGYIANNAGLVTLTLPAAAVIGSIVRIGGKGAGLYSIAQNAGQTIHYGNQDSTTGIGGSIDATHRYDAIELVCTTANTDFLALSSVGNFNVI